MKRYRIQLTEGEKFIIAIDDHWVSLFVPFLLFLLGWVMALFLSYCAWFIVQDHVFWSGLLYLIAICTSVVVSHWFFIYLFQWELSAWIITTRRIIDLRFLPYVRHDVGFTMINEIHDIEKHKRGLVKNLLDYGDIEVNLAAIPRSTIFTYVPKPSAFANLIQTIHKASNPDELNVEDLRKLYLM